MTLDQQKLKQHLTDIDIICLDSINSTNDYVQKIDVVDKQAVLCLAEQQSHGRGQHDRVWHSPRHKNIYLSFRKAVPVAINQLCGLSLVVGLTVCTILEKLYPKLSNDLSLKWPNDIYCDGKKLGGILIEMVQADQQQCDVVIGVGLNVFMQHDDDQIDQSWASLIQYAPESVSRENIIIALIKQLQININLLLKFSFKYFLKAWQSKDFLTDKHLLLESGKQQYTGNYMGVNEQGCLVIKTIDNQTISFASAKLLAITKR